jgi:DNA-binding response OmpR family regulator
MRVLIADDDLWTLDVLEVTLLLDGHDVVRATDGVEALAAARAAAPDLAIVDWMMPFMDGITLVRALRAEEHLDGLPILMLTARSTDTDVWTGWSSGVDSYVTKPLDVHVLRSEIDHVCGIASRSMDDAVDAPGGTAVARLQEQWTAAVSDAIAARRLTMLDVANAGGVAPSTLASVLAGRAWAHPTTIVALSAFLDIELPAAAAS